MNEGLRLMAEQLGINPGFATWKECADVAYHRFIACEAERDDLQERLNAEVYRGDKARAERDKAESRCLELEATTTTNTKSRNP